MVSMSTECQNCFDLSRRPLTLDVVDLEYTVSSTGNRFDFNVNGNSLSGNHNIGETMIRQLGESTLLSEGKGNISDVGLCLRSGDSQKRVRSLQSLLDRWVRAELDSGRQTDSERSRGKYELTVDGPRLQQCLARGCYR